MPRLRGLFYFYKLQKTTESPNYYAILTPEIRYNKNLPPAAKLLYAEITALCNKHGFCWASNKYFAELYGVTNRTVRLWLESLRCEGFIKVRLDDKAAHTKREIYLDFAKQGGNFLPTPRKKISPPPRKKISPVILQDNNIAYGLNVNNKPPSSDDIAKPSVSASTPSNKHKKYKELRTVKLMTSKTAFITYVYKVYKDYHACSKEKIRDSILGALKWLLKAKEEKKDEALFIDQWLCNSYIRGELIGDYVDVGGETEIFIDSCYILFQATDDISNLG